MSNTLYSNPYILRFILTLLSFLLVCTSIAFAFEERPAFENQVQSIGELIQQDNLPQAKTSVDQFWAEHTSDEGFVDAVRRIKDHYWREADYIEHFDLCERIVTAFPNDPLSIGIQVDQVTGYIKLKDMAKASEKLEQFWSRYSTDDRFVDFARRIKDQYWMDGYHAEHFELCERLIQAFPNDPLVMNIWADDVTGYVRVDNMPKADEKLEEFWAKYSSKDGFVQHIRYIKDVCWIEGEYQAHFDLCDRIVKAFPNDPLTIRIGADEITGHIRLNEMDTAREKLEQLWERYSSNEQFVEQVRYIKDVCWLEGEYGLHFELCDRVSKVFPDNILTLGIRTDEITGYIKLKQINQADEKLKQFLVECSSDQQFLEHLNAIAIQYNLIGNYQKADELYQYGMGHSSPTDNTLLLIHTGRIISHAGMSDDPNGVPTNIPTQIDILLTDNADNPYIAESLFMVIEQYTSMAQNVLREKNNALFTEYYREAIEICEPHIPKIVTSDSEEQAHVYYFLANAYQTLGEFAQAKDYYQEVVEKTPRYQFAWDAQFKIAICNEKLAQLNKMDLQTALELSKAAYQKVIQNYPSSPAVQIAQRKLAQMEQE